MWKVREFADKVTNVVMNYTEVEAKVREATCDDAWGPHGTLMYEISQYTYTYEYFPEVMGMLWKRLFHENQKNWRRVYKSLLLLMYLIRNGSEKVVASANEHLRDLKRLQTYTFIDEYGKDQGINVVQKVKELTDLLQDLEKLKDERKKAKKSRDKYVGIDSHAFKSGENNGPASAIKYIHQSIDKRKQIEDVIKDFKKEESFSDEENKSIHKLGQNTHPAATEFADFTVFADGKDIDNNNVVKKDLTKQGSLLEFAHANGNFADFDNVDELHSIVVHEDLHTQHSLGSKEEETLSCGAKQSNVDLLNCLSYVPSFPIAPVNHYAFNIGPNQSYNCPQYYPNMITTTTQTQDLPSTWQNPGVNISLETLKIASAKPAARPINNLLMQQQLQTFQGQGLFPQTHSSQNMRPCT
ncbi:hypothetical protein HELRODRAFT_108184 [Helobdella robusta]|uniref:ENTH domain-containing protein n=1 Tax=Helobdella robusta TaxID=6412 RepID=T1EEG5_HELRO|nr:hypothetical protein HELRODRAFT_108184 [Helobdella robusta]ESN92816.1 hypothetical protein HELRODRAFT_108184 [Helobdella robusta]